MNELIALGRELREHGEPGFLEIETHRILKERFTALGLPIREFDGIPGFIVAEERKAKKKTVALLADMDALPSGEGGGYRHSCGHDLQMTALYGTARPLRYNPPEVLSQVAFAATPAEEYLDFDRRESLRRQGRIRHYSGKQELIARGDCSGPLNLS